MPHFVVECSDTIRNTTSVDELLKSVHDSAAATNLFDRADIKVRVRLFDHFSVAGKREDFLHVFGHIMEGRTSEQRAHLSRTVVANLARLLPDVSVISMNVVEFEKATYCNRRMLTP
jgi:5-carboxymethyl-2-hydroxymuconate isomerase